MSFLYLVLLVTQSYALQYALPENFGGKTDFSDRGWRMLLGQLSSDVKVGLTPTAQINIAEEPTCLERYPMCSTTYFGKLSSMKLFSSAQLWVKWHEDFTPFACSSPVGCSITSVRSVVDLSAQSNGWSVTASLNASTGTNNDIPTINGKPKAELSLRISEEPITAKTMVSPRTLTYQCSKNHMCYIQTGTLMMNITGHCDARPLIVCDRHYYPCEEFLSPRIPLCLQWSRFTRKHCQRKVYKTGLRECSMNVAVTGDNGEPISFQVFEQKPMPGKKHIAQLDFSSTESPLGELPDGSSGAWMAWKS